MSLRLRLLISYLLVVAVFLLVAVFALIALLRANPFQRLLTVQQLTIEARLVARLSREAGAQPGLVREAILRRLQQRDAENDTRLLFVDGATGEVLSDSGSALAGRNLLAHIAGSPSSLSADGELDIDGAAWLYAGQPVAAGQRDGVWVVTAAPIVRAGLLRDPVFVALLNPMLVAAAIALAIAVALAVIVARSIAGPIQHVAAAADAIASGDLAQSAPIEGPSEVRELATNFNAMAGRVRTSQQSQRDFLANVSHELKTPLTSIRGFAQAIVDGAAGDGESIRKSAAIIRAEADRMARMVSELLDLSRIETGQLAMQRDRVQVGDVLRGCVERQALRAQGGGLRLTIDLPDGLPPIEGDGDRLAQVFNNLIDNALKHTPAGGRVAVTARAMTGSSVARRGKPWPGAVEVTVADSGPGIPPQDLSRIFERFYQVDKSRARPASGGSLGLGLAIAKEIVAAHGGSIHAESVTGLGTQFVVRLPLLRDQPVPDLPA